MAETDLNLPVIEVLEELLDAYRVVERRRNKWNNISDIEPTFEEIEDVKKAFIVPYSSQMVSAEGVVEFFEEFASYDFEDIDVSSYYLKASDLFRTKTEVPLREVYAVFAHRSEQEKAIRNANLHRFVMPVVNDIFDLERLMQQIIENYNKFEKNDLKRAAKRIIHQYSVHSPDPAEYPLIASIVGNPNIYHQLVGKFILDQTEGPFFGDVIRPPKDDGYRRMIQYGEVSDSGISIPDNNIGYLVELERDSKRNFVSDLSGDDFFQQHISHGPFGDESYKVHVMFRNPLEPRRGSTAYTIIIPQSEPEIIEQVTAIIEGEDPHEFFYALMGFVFPGFKFSHLDECREKYEFGTSEDVRYVP